MNGALIPWTRWGGGDFSLTSSVCQVEQTWENQKLQVAAAHVEIKSTRQNAARGAVLCRAATIGAAGGPVTKIALNDKKDAFLVDNRLAVWAERRRRRSASASKTMSPITPSAARCRTISASVHRAAVAAGSCGTICGYRPKAHMSLGSFVPCYPADAQSAHQWDGKSPWAQLDEAKLNPKRVASFSPIPGSTITAS